MSNPLPQELLDSIVDFVPSHEYQTLASCSLAFRGLATPARPRQFHTITLMHGPPGRSKARRSQITPSQKFSALLERSPDIAKLIKTLNIIDGEDERYWTTNRNAGRALAMVIPLLTALENLSFRVEGRTLTRWSALAAGVKAALKDIAPQLQGIHFCGLIFDSAPAVKEIFTILQASMPSRLKELSLSFEADGPPLGEIRTETGENWRLQLQSLVFSDHEIGGQMTNFVTKVVDLSCLRSLSFSGLAEEELDVFFRALPPANVIEEFTVWFISDYLPPQGPPNFATHFPRLRRLYLSAFFPLAVFRGVLENCLSIPTLSLDSITCESPHFQFLFDGTQADEQAEWQRFVEVLKRFPKSVQGMQFGISSWLTNTKPAVECSRRVASIVDHLDASHLLRVETVLPHALIHSFYTPKAEQ
ncbi:hypothetical protein MIND_00130900 [Mycena indigotica]|uniref:F-box domain-containing protein n=1 Tax=Mycena indigotica TaxID=2126181 RepID=A0A8H6WIH3_9AGAR|nr:uncharacterized protein MIND_00130900 [Mycena indigotica]KAF7316128.1 hypothetical protein MIND_00130900 [Mycena indigotica]